MWFSPVNQKNVFLIYGIQFREQCGDNLLHLFEKESNI